MGFCAVLLSGAAQALNEPDISCGGATMKRTTSTLAALAGLFTLTAPVAAQDFPSKPINLVVPFAAGGSTDLVGRIVAEAMSQQLGQQVLVVNQAGAGGVLGATSVADAPADGYTILMGTIATHALSASLYATPPFDPVADFEPISLLVTVPNVLLVNPEFPANTVEELIALLEAEPESHAYASSGNGTPLHLSGELFKSMAGVDMVHVPYQGSGPALVDALSGAVPIIFDNLPSATEHMKAGTLRPLAVTTLERAASFPDVPTMDEAGVPGYETNTWNALFAPAGTPDDVVARLNEAAVAAVSDPAVKERLAEVGAVVVASSAEELGAHVEAEVARWAPVIEKAGVQIQ
jgi:tripartite-type tricarboxylate transporter receptor subunit TctC